jgi:hypothetical protein
MEWHINENETKNPFKDIGITSLILKPLNEHENTN